MGRPPSHLEAPLARLIASLSQAQGKRVDLLTAPWLEVETSVINLLGRPYEPNLPEHQQAALGLAVAFGQRLVASDQAFWFPMREAPEGAMLGFPEAVLTLSPYTRVTDALRRAQLARLDEDAVNVRRALAEARFAPTAGAIRLSPADYARLFDPSLLQFLVLDRCRMDALWATRADQLSRHLLEALERAGTDAALRSQLEQQLLGALGRLDSAKSLGEQLEQAPRLGELLADLFAGKFRTGSAPDEFWEDAVFPLLDVGVADSFPPLESEEVGITQQETDPLLRFLDAIPDRQPAPEKTVFGLFEAGEVSLLHPSLGRSSVPRLLTVNAEALERLVASFDPRAMEAALARFSANLSEKSTKPVQTAAPSHQIEDAALALFREFKTLLAGAGSGSALAMRRLTEAEALSDGALAPVRQAVQAHAILAL